MCVCTAEKEVKQFENVTKHCVGIVHYFTWCQKSAKYKLGSMASSQFDHTKIDWDALDLYQEFERFRSHVTFVFEGPLSELTAKQRAGWLGTWISEQGREVYKTFSWAEGERDDPFKVLDKFASYIRPRKNKRIDRHRFKQRKQGTAESFDHFVKDLRLILMDCEYPDPDDMLIDAIIAGVREKRVQERLLDKGEDLTLPKVLEITQQFELSQKQIQIVREEESQVRAVHVKTKYPVATKKAYQKNQTKYVQKEMHVNRPKSVLVVARTHSINGIKENAQQKALSVPTVTSQTTGWQYVVKDPSTQ